MNENANENRCISEVTRRKIADAIALMQFWWAGQLNEVEFLRRLYDLDSLPSYDSRFSTATQDIQMHRVTNPMDWSNDWIFNDERFQILEGSDEVLLNFLAEMLHPLVRPKVEEVKTLLITFNELLSPDGYELVQTSSISGHPVYGWNNRTGFHGDRPLHLLENRPNLRDPVVLHEHLDRIGAGLGNDPAAAIGSCKELIESLCKIILAQSGVDFGAGEDMPSLYRKVANLLKLSVESVPTSAQGSASAHKILRTLVTTVQSLGELRNELGLGHGREVPSPALARHARLALNSTVTVCEFLLDTWQERSESGKLNPDGLPQSAAKATSQSR